MTSESKKTELLLCYHCGNTTIMEVVAQYERITPEFDNEPGVAKIQTGEYVNNWRIFFCPVCEKVTVREDYWDHFIFEAHDPDRKILYPHVSESSKDIPIGVSNAFDAALKVRNIDGAVCVLSLRRTLEKLCKDKGQTRGTLYDKLKRLSSDGVLPPILDKMANVLKEMGNAAAHADDVEFSASVVSQMVEFTRIILDYVYVLPNKLARIEKFVTIKDQNEESESSPA